MDGENSMTPQLDDQFLSAMGLNNLSEDQKQESLGDVLYTLNMRVAERVVGSMDENQLKEFDALTEKDPAEEELALWLKSNVPNYAALIEEEAQKMKQEHDDTMQKVSG